MVSRFLYLVRHGEAIDDGVLSDVGREQARLVGRRLADVAASADVAFSAIHHSPLPRATQTAELIAGHLPGVAVHSSQLLGDYLPSSPDRANLAPVEAEFLDSHPPEALVDGPVLAAAAIERYAGPAADGPGDPAGVGVHELIVTHNFLIAWFVRHALDAPTWRWLGLNQANGALTVIAYRPDRSPSLMAFNDMGHLPAALRWTGFPAELRF